MRNTIALCAAVASLSSLAFAADPVFTPVLLRGDPAPGLPGSSVFGLSTPGVNSDGTLLFGGHTVYGGNYSDTLWYGRRNELSLLAREYGTAPDGTSFGGIGWYTANNGQVVFESGDTIWGGPVGSIQKLARFGEQATGLATGTTFSGRRSHPEVNGLGQIAFSYETTSATGTSGEGIWLGTAGNLQPVVYSGMAAPGTSATFTTYDSPVLSNAGVAFSASLSDWTRSVWLGTPGELTLVARQGQQAAGLPAGVNYKYLNIWNSLNNAGQIAFKGTVQGPSMAETDALWAGTPGALKLIAMEGQQAPHLPAGATINSFWNPLIGSNGMVSFEAYLQGTGVTMGNDAVLYQQHGDETRFILREGDTAPGTAAQFSSWEDPSLNAKGESVLLGYLKGTGVNYSNDTGIWFINSLGEAALIARTGQSIDLGGGDLRTIDSLYMASFSGGEDYQWKAINNDSVVAFYASFTDGSEAILQVAVPEPAAIALLPAAAMLLRRRRQRAS